METFTKYKPLIENPDFRIQKEAALSSLDILTVDEPIRNVITALNDIPFCFTIQSCSGHFGFGEQKDPKNLDPLPQTETIGDIEYRIAYVALCVHRSELAATFLGELSDLQKMDPAYIQFGCARWFWERQINSYVVQVEPERYSEKDSVRIPYREARHIEGLKRDVFIRIHSVVKSWLG